MTFKHFLSLICMFFLQQPEMVRRDNKYAKSLSMSTKLKFPFPHMFAVVVKEISTGSMQLLSQGTADIILDSCVDYWDGHDLCPLAPSDRKKVQDFYQRSSLTAYCTAFAYRPLSKGVSDKLTQVYLELPSDSRHLYHNHRSPTPLLWDCSRSVLEPKIKAPLGPFFSTGVLLKDPYSLLYNDSPCSDVTDAESCFDMQCNQVFIGMVTMQYQAQSDMVHLIEQLERACIRFVHFSKENELRSRVFSEKMGLESGWNCHISLLSDRNSGLASNTGPGYMPHRRISQSARKLHSSGSPPFDNKFSNLESSRTMSFSAPSAINMEHSVVKFNTENHPLIKYSVDESETDQNISTQKINSSDSVQMQTEICNVQHDWQSLSGLTDSTEQSAPINFDMSNRAKLPRGIENIRPHIEQIDNVPLLVSLFTDCTAAGTREMLHIMQEYGEVVCVMGSSASNENMGIFMQADASIAVEPLYPQVCQNLEPFINFNEKITPTELSRFLNSIACSISLRREEPVSFYYLVFEARHYISSIWNSVQFWLCCLVTMSFMQTVAALFMLPALLSPGQVLWIICLIVPLLSISLMGTPIDHDIMKKPQSKNQIEFNTEVAGFVLWCYGIKFVPLIVVIITTFAGTLSGHCRDICDMQNCTCVLFYLPKFEESSNITKNWTDVEHSYTLLTAQHFTVIVILLHFVAISAGFVHRQHLFWSRSPHTNRFWLLAVIILLFVQPIYTVLGLVYSSKENSGYDEFHVVHAFQIFAFCSPILTILVNETVKKQEIKVQLYQLMILQERDLYYLTYSISYFYQVRYRKNFNVYFPNNFNSGLSWFFKVNLRYQRRARLDFGTKLGMNSPF